MIDTEAPEAKKAKWLFLNGVRVVPGSAVVFRTLHGGWAVRIGVHPSELPEGEFREPIMLIPGFAIQDDADRLADKINKCPGGLRRNYRVNGVHLDGEEAR